MVRRFLDNPRAWVFPSPLRWGYLGITTIWSGLTGVCSPRSLATLSTVAGILSVILTWLLGRELVDPTAALAGAALVATSPLQLALGRRALADEPFCLIVLVSLWALVRYLSGEPSKRRGLWLLLWIMMTTLAMATKEQFVLIYPVILVFWWLRSGRRVTRGDIAAAATPPLLFAGVFTLLAGSMTAFVDVAKATTSTIGAWYAVQYQAGPAHRLIIDSLAIAPMITMLAIVAIAFIVLRETADAAERHLAVLLVGILSVHALLVSQNLRYIVSADPLARLLVAALLWRAVRERSGSVMTLTLLVIVNGAIELALFAKVFLVGRVYDPTTYDLLRALEMLPR